MTASAFDIAILGAGPVGRVLAPDAGSGGAGSGPHRAAARHGPASTADAAPAADPRVLAMNHGSRVLLESLDAWPERSADIRSIHVPQRGRLPQPDPPYRLRRAATGQRGRLFGPLRPARSPRRPVRRDPAAGTARPDPGAGRRRRARRPGRHRIALPGGGAVRRRGRRGPAPRLRPARRADHGARRPPRPGWAWERFTSEGPLALLPHPHTPEAHSVVWCSTPQRAAELVALDNAASRAR